MSFAESGGYSDAVGDVTLVNDKWGPSIGLFQIRSLRNPLAFNAADRYRYAWALRHPDFNAHAAYVISQGGTTWDLWSVYKSGSYQQHVGKDYEIKTGHIRAEQWNS